MREIPTRVSEALNDSPRETIIVVQCLDNTTVNTWEELRSAATYQSANFLMFLTNHVDGELILAVHDLHHAPGGTEAAGESQGGVCHRHAHVHRQQLMREP